MPSTRCKVGIGEAKKFLPSSVYPGLGSLSPIDYEHPALAKSFTLHSPLGAVLLAAVMFSRILSVCQLPSLCSVAASLLYSSTPLRSVLAPACLLSTLTLSASPLCGFYYRIHRPAGTAYTLINDYKSFDWSKTFSVVWATSFC